MFVSAVDVLMLMVVGVDIDVLMFCIAMYTPPPKERSSSAAVSTHTFTTLCTQIREVGLPSTSTLLFAGAPTNEGVVHPYGHTAAQCLKAQIKVLKELLSAEERVDRGLPNTVTRRGVEAAINMYVRMSDVLQAHEENKTIPSINHDGINDATKVVSDSGTKRIDHILSVDMSSDEDTEPEVDTEPTAVAVFGSRAVNHSEFLSNDRGRTTNSTAVDGRELQIAVPLLSPTPLRLPWTVPAHTPQLCHDLSLTGTIFSPLVTSWKGTSA